MPSIIWTFFEKGKDADAKCKICGHKSFYKTGYSTTNMLRHVKTKHPFELEKEEGKIKRPGKRSQSAATERDSDDLLLQSVSTSKKSESATLVNDEADSSAQSRSCETKPKTLQDTLLTTLGKKVPYKRDSSKKKALDERVLDLIVMDMQPLSVVEDAAFRRLVNELDPKYEIISRKQLTQVLLPAKYKSEKAKLMSKINQVDSMSVTTDQWSSRTNEGYTTITGHFVDDNWTLHSPVLLTRHKPQRHTAVNLAEELDAAFIEFDIKSKVTAVVTDNASNITAAVSRLDEVEDRQSCFAHTLNLCVRHAIKNDATTKTVVKKVKDIVSFFRSSNNAVDELKEIHSMKNTKFYKLKQDVETRWNSTYMMLESFEKQRVAVSTVLGNKGKVHLCLTDSELITLDEILVVLKPFFEITQEISSEQHTSLSKMIPMVQILHKKLASKSHLGLSYELKYQLQSYFDELEQQTFAKFATFLDPRFKDVFFNKEKKAEVKKSISDYLESVKIPEQKQAEKEEERKTKETEENQKKDEHFWDEFDKEREDQVDSEREISVIEIELIRYLEGQLSSRKTDPLLFWKLQEKFFPNLAKAAKKYLSIPATSVPSERVFSKAGEIVSARRSRIKSKNVDMILFLNKVQTK